MAGNINNRISPRSIFSFFGVPGSGKGTLAERCQRELNFQVLSTGKLCRKYISLGTELGKMLEPLLLQGKLIPDELITQMVKEWLVDASAEAHPILLDGYPRTKRQAELFLPVLSKCFSQLDFRVVFFDVMAEEIVHRLTNRLVCENESCQAVYSAVAPQFKPSQDGICDHCGSILVKRDDDTEEIINKRFEVFNRSKKDLLSFYKSKLVPMEKLCAKESTPNDVFNKFKNFYLSLDKNDNSLNHNVIEQ